MGRTQPLSLLYLVLEGASAGSRVDSAMRGHVQAVSLSAKLRSRLASPVFCRNRQNTSTLLDTIAFYVYLQHHIPTIIHFQNRSLRAAGYTMEKLFCRMLSARRTPRERKIHAYAAQETKTPGEKDARERASGPTDKMSVVTDSDIFQAKLSLFFSLVGSLCVIL